MENNVNYSVVGAFVIILTAAIIMMIIWLSSGLSTQSYSYYKVYMKEAVTGLSPESSVEYNGVNVGTVASININHKNPRVVILILKVKKDTPVTMGTRAKLDMRSISGVSYILLEDKGLDMRPLETLPGQTYPVINTLPSLFVRLDTALTQLSESFHQLAGSVSSLLDTENLESIKVTLKNLREFSHTLAINGPQFNSILHNTAKTAKDIRLQTVPYTNRAILNFEEMTDKLTDVSEDLKQDPSILIRGKPEPGAGPGE